MLNKALIGPWPKYVPLRFLFLFFRFRENERFTTQCQNKKSWRLKIEKQIENTNSNNSARPAGQRRHVKVSHEDHRTQHPTHSYCSTATQPHRPPVNSQQANHKTSPDILGPLFPGVRAKANIVGGKFRMMHTLEDEVGSSFSVKIQV